MEKGLFTMHKKAKAKSIIATLATLVGICLFVGIGYEINFLLKQDQDGYRSKPSFVPHSDSPDEHEYEIDPETRVLSLDQGKTEIFNSTFAAP
jgi:hypothetical protein